MLYNLTYRFSANYKCEVEDADSLKEAIEIADEEHFCQADFGEAEDVDGEAIVVENEDGQRIFDKTTNSPATSIQNKALKYFLTYRLSARYQCKVEAKSLNEAIEIADDEYFGQADFGEAENIDGEVIVVENEDGKRLLDRTKTRRKKRPMAS